MASLAQTAASGRKLQMGRGTVSGKMLEELAEEDDEPVSKIGADESDSDEDPARKMLRKKKWIGKKLKQKVSGDKMSKKVLYQKLRTLKIKEGISQGIPRCSMKLLLVREGLGHMMPWFTKAGYVRVGNCLPRYKLFRYRHFEDPKASKPPQVIQDIPRLYLSKNASKAAEDGDVDLKKLDSDRRRQVKRLPVFDEQAGMKIVQFERYDREQDLVYEIKDLQTCALEWEHYDPKTILKIDPREEVLLRRMHRADMRVLDQLARLTNAMKKKEKLFRNMKIISRIIFYFLIVLVFASFDVHSQYTFEQSFGLMFRTRNFLTVIVLVVGRCMLIRASSLSRESLEMAKLRKCLAVIKRFRMRLLKFRAKSQKARPEKFDTVLDDIGSFFDERTREDMDKERRRQEEELLRRHLELGIQFDQWLAEKEALIRRGICDYRITGEIMGYAGFSYHGTPQMVRSLKESEDVLPPPVQRFRFGDGDRHARFMEKGQFYQNVTQHRTISVDEIAKWNPEVLALQDSIRPEHARSMGQAMQQATQQLPVLGMGGQYGGQYGGYGQGMGSSSSGGGYGQGESSYTSSSGGYLQGGQPFGHGSQYHNYGQGQGRMANLLGDVDEVDGELGGTDLGLAGGGGRGYSSVEGTGNYGISQSQSGPQPQTYGRTREDLRPPAFDQTGSSFMESSGGSEILGGTQQTGQMGSGSGTGQGPFAPGVNAARERGIDDPMNRPLGDGDDSSGSDTPLGGTRNS